MSSISECLSSLSYYLCCYCCCDTKERATTQSLLAHEGLNGRHVTPISPSMNGNSSFSETQDYGSLREGSQQDLDYTAATVAGLLPRPPSPFSASSVPPSTSFNRPLTPPSSPGSESDTERSPFDWRKHATDHTSPHK